MRCDIYVFYVSHNQTIRFFISILLCGLIEMNKLWKAKFCSIIISALVIVNLVTFSGDAMN